MSSDTHPREVPTGASPPKAALRLVLETALDAVVVMRDDGIVAGWNDRAVGVFGWTRAEAVGRAMADLIIPERYREAHKSGLKRYLASGEATVLGRRIEVSGIRKNGEEFPVELSIAPIPGESLLFVCFLRDLTERNALRKAQSEVARMSQRMAMGGMAACIVHEINQPLAAIAANADAGLRWLSRERPDIEEARAAFKRIVGDSHRASAIVEEIRLIFRNDGVTLAALDVNELIGEVLSRLRADLENHRIMIDTELQGGLPRVSANAVQLRQVMVNLITNAADAMSVVTNRQHRLRLSTQAHGPDGLLITVEDSGSGINPGHADRIFEPFFTTKSEGMGMGLSICRSIVENHGGHISVAAGRAHGSIFQVSLPIAPMVAADAATVTP